MIVQEKQRAIQMRRNAEYVGDIEEVHVEGFNQATGQWIGRTSQNKTLNFTDPDCASPQEAEPGRQISGCAGDARGPEQSGRRERRQSAGCAVGWLEEGRNNGSRNENPGPMMDPVTNMPIVVLKDSTAMQFLPIWVGIYEANAIALEIEKVTTPRPMTHDLIKTSCCWAWIRDQESGGQRAERRYVLRGDLAGTRRRS